MKVASFGRNEDISGEGVTLGSVPRQSRARPSLHAGDRAVRAFSALEGANFKSTPNLSRTIDVLYLKILGPCRETKKRRVELKILVFGTAR